MKKSARLTSVVAFGLWACGGLAFAQALDTESPPTGYPAPLAPDAVAPQSPAQLLPRAQGETLPSQAPEAAIKPKEYSDVGRLGPARGSFVSLSTERTDFNFKDADIIGILRAFAIKFNKNIIAGPGVSGRVNIQLSSVPFDEGFRLMLDQMGLIAIQRSANVIEVIRSKDIPALVEVFSLKYRFAPDVYQTILDMLGPREREYTVISVDRPSNALIVTSSNDVVQKIKTLLEQLDLPTQQITIKARLIEMTVGNTLQLGITWNSKSSVKGGTIRSFKDEGNFVLDPLGNAGSQATPAKFAEGGVLEWTTILDRTQLYSLLQLLQQDNRGKTISEPMILTGNNKSAKIHVGQNLPVKTSLVAQTGTVQSVQYIPEGVDLEVTPIIAPGSNVISFKIKVGVSEFVGFQSDNPITTERVAQTELSVESGKTVVIGGLIKDKMLDVESGIPFLKDIPILGYLFKNKRKTKERTELLIFITPELVAVTRN